ncbi:MAG TPA: UTRA domain-containing protein, partial [Firmicutes bacterium]|nr:UTRA domain-containing protein [Bacillota bacterium]
DFSRLPATPEVAQALGLREGEEIIRIERLRLADGNVVGWNLSHLPGRLCPGLAADDLGGGSLYRLLERKYGLYVAKAHRDFETVGADAHLAELLGVAVGTPVLRLSGTVATADGTTVDYCLEYYR